MDNSIRNSSPPRQWPPKYALPGCQIHRQHGNSSLLPSTDPIEQSDREASQQVTDEGADEEQLPLEAGRPELAGSSPIPLIQVFKQASIDREIQAILKGADEKSSQILPTLKDAQRAKGYRHGLSGKERLSSIRENIQKMVSEMPNFSLAADVLAAELALAVSGPGDEFRVTPILLHGSPGIGKSRFASLLAGALDVGFDKISMGSSSGAFELCGVSRGWGTTRPGRIAKLLARGKSAAPVVVLDEIDKIGSDPRFPVIPTLLDLLERDSARNFRDECLELEFDASRIIFIATANEVHEISGPLLSRMRMIEILPPTPEQRFQVATRIARGYEDRFGIAFSEDFLSVITEKASIDLRGIQQILRLAACRT